MLARDFPEISALHVDHAALRRGGSSVRKPILIVALTILLLQPVSTVLAWELERPDVTSWVIDQRADNFNTNGEASVMLGVDIAKYHSSFGMDQVQSSVGVKVGDWAKYSISFEGYVGWKPKDERGKDWVRVEVQEISNNLVTIRETTHFRNGTDKVAIISHDVEMGSVGTYMIAANLSDGDRIFVEGIAPRDPFYINYTTWRNYGASRQANVLRLTFVTRFFMYPLNFTEEACWDKTTGFLLEHKQEAFIEQYENTTLGVWLMRVTETNLWEMPADARPYWSQWLPVITIGTITVVTVSAVLMERRKKNNSAETSSKTATTSALNCCRRLRHTPVHSTTTQRRKTRLHNHPRGPLLYH